MQRLLCIWLLFSFLGTSLTPPASAQLASPDFLHSLPKPGTMVNLSPAFEDVLIKGLKVHPENPLALDFIVDTGDTQLAGNSASLKAESERLIKYFYAALTLPEKDIWVNLSPYEKGRIIPEMTGQTEMGRDMLAEDYMLKQITASLIYPEKGLGKEFWDKVYSASYERFGTTQIPVNTFNKVWIVADKASVYENKDTVLVMDSHLKVMLEEDYKSLYKHEGLQPANGTHSIGNQIVREIVLPALEKEVNEGKNFATLRQIFHAIILAKWYKENLKTALLNQVYSDKSKIAGIDLQDKSIKDKIYQKYLQAYKKGVFNFIKEDIDQTTSKPVPRKYFSGGVSAAMTVDRLDETQASERLRANYIKGRLFDIGSFAVSEKASPAMTAFKMDFSAFKGQWADGKIQQGEPLTIILKEGAPKVVRFSGLLSSAALSNPPGVNRGIDILKYDPPGSVPGTNSGFINSQDILSIVMTMRIDPDTLHENLNYRPEDRDYRPDAAFAKIFREHKIILVGFDMNGTPPGDLIKGRLADAIQSYNKEGNRFPVTHILVPGTTSPALLQFALENRIHIVPLPRYSGVERYKIELDRILAENHNAKIMVLGERAYMSKKLLRNHGAQSSTLYQQFSNQEVYSLSMDIGINQNGGYTPLGELLKAQGMQPVGDTLVNFNGHNPLGLLPIRYGSPVYTENQPMNYFFDGYYISANPWGDMEIIGPNAREKLRHFKDGGLEALADFAAPERRAWFANIMGASANGHAPAITTIDVDASVSPERLEQFFLRLRNNDFYSSGVKIKVKDNRLLLLDSGDETSAPLTGVRKTVGGNEIVISYPNKEIVRGQDLTVNITSRTRLDGRVHAGFIEKNGDGFWHKPEWYPLVQVKGPDANAFKYQVSVPTPKYPEFYKAVFMLSIDGQDIKLNGEEPFDVRFERPIHRVARDSIARELTASPAMTAPGGIDLNPSNIDLHKSGAGVRIGFDPAMAARLRQGQFDGIIPEITGITPISDIFSAVGLPSPQA